MMKNSYALILGLVLLACSEKEPEEKMQIQHRIEAIEDSLSRVTETSHAELKLLKGLNQRLIKELTSFYRSFPDDSYAPACLDKLHMKFSGMRLYHESAAYGDTLIDKYPDYPNRAMVLESQVTTYNYFIVPRNKTKVKKYLTLLLKEDLELPEDKKEEYKFTLENLDLSWEELVKKQEKSEN